MSEEMIWNIFTKTGNIETFLEYTKTKEMNSIDKGNFDQRDDN